MYRQLLVLLVCSCVSKEQQPPKQNEPPVAALRVPVIASTNEAIELDASLSLDPEKEPLVFFFFISGATPIRTNSPTVTYTFSSPGLYSIHLVVVDLHGERSEALQDIVVRNEPQKSHHLCETAPDCGVGDECREGLCYSFGGNID